MNITPAPTFKFDFSSNINLIKGDLLATSCAVIGHGVNCRGVMGAGVAKAIRVKYPEVFSNKDNPAAGYNELCKSGKFTPGMVHPIKLQDDSCSKYVINLATQMDYGRTSGRKYATLEDVQVCLEKTKFWMIDRELKSLAIPPLGCGLGGLSFNDVAIIIDNVFKSSSIEVEVRYI